MRWKADGDSLVPDFPKLISVEARTEPVLCGTSVSQQGSSHHHQLEIPTPPSHTIPISKANCAQARHGTAEAIQAGSGKSVHLQGHLGKLGKPFPVPPAGSGRGSWAVPAHRESILGLV